MDAEQRDRLDRHIEHLQSDADGLSEREYDQKAILVLLKAQIVMLQAMEWQIGGIYEEAKKTNENLIVVRSLVEKVWYTIFLAGVVLAIVLLAILSQIK